jgi:hypothetical protein
MISKRVQKVKAEIDKLIPIGKVTIEKATARDLRGAKKLWKSGYKFQFEGFGMVQGILVQTEEGLYDVARAVHLGLTMAGRTPPEFNREVARTSARLRTSLEKDGVI